MTPDRIEKKILLRAPLARVWRALADSREFGRWFGMRLDGPFEPGARLRGTMVPTEVDPGVAEQQRPFEGEPCDLVIDAVEPERRLAFRWQAYPLEPGEDPADHPMTRVVFELAEQEEGVLLTVTESGFDRVPLDRRAKAFAANDEGWAIQTTLIEKYLAQAA